MNRIRGWLRWLWAGSLVAGGGMWRAKQDLRRRQVVVVLAFHRILDDTDFQRTQSLAGMLMRRRTFEQLARYASRRFRPVDPAQVRFAGDAGPLRLAFTFDDGWRDNYSAAFPVACTFGIPLTVFLCPEFIGRSSPFWPEQVAASIRVARPQAGEAEIEKVIEEMKRRTPEDREEAFSEMTPASGRITEIACPDQTLSWAQVAEMDAAGVTFGAHTQTHQVLTHVPEGRARREIVDSKAGIEHALGKPCALFAYPNGDHSRVTRRLVSEAGFTRAFTTRRGAWTTATDPLEIPRKLICEDDVVGPRGRFSPAMFEYTVFWKVWRAARAAGELA